MLLEDRVVLVTGASRGIGRAIAGRMAGEGAKVVGTATTEAGAEKITKWFADEKLDGIGMQLDVTEPEQIERVIKAITADYGAVNILVNNAGVTRDNLFLRMKDDEWSGIIETNLSSVFRMCKACIKPMVKARYGRIINISSVVGLTGNAGQVNYSAAKAGMIGLGKSLAREIGSRGVTVNTIAPGFIVSDMTAELSDEQKSALLAEIALGRMGEPEEIAQSALFLASPMADYITGQTLHVNGGMYMP